MIDAEVKRKEEDIDESKGILPVVMVKGKRRNFSRYKQKRPLPYDSQQSCSNL